MEIQGEEVTVRRELPAKSAGVRRPIRAFAGWFGICIAAIWIVSAISIVAMRWINPPSTAVQMERHVEAWIDGRQYRKQYQFVPLNQISPNLQHAVITAEDKRFYNHRGFDWQAIGAAAEGDMEGGRVRGASTITQQLVKNLFFGLGRSVVRKGAEATLVPVAELALGKQRILELYLNVVEWGPGIYGAQAATNAYYGSPVQSVDREEAARLAAVLPLPLRRRPELMDEYSAIILRQMGQLGW